MKTIHVGHSPDPDDAFMFCALTFGRLDTGPLRYVHHLHDIETLNRKAEAGEYELTAISFHAYAWVAERYSLLRHGGSFGDGYGPLLVTREPLAAPSAAPAEWLCGKTVAVPGLRTSAWLALQVFARSGGLNAGDFRAVPTAFDRIMSEVSAGRCDAGLLIHEGQLTYGDAASGRLHKAVDLGAWWKERTGLPLPLGGNALRRDLPPDDARLVSAHMLASIRWALDHRAEALAYAMQHARGLDRDRADRFVGMYVNEYTLDCGAAGQRAVELFLAEGARAGALTARPEVQWVAAPPAAQG